MTMHGGKELPKHKDIASLVLKISRTSNGAYSGVSSSAFRRVHRKMWECERLQFAFGSSRA